MSLNSNLNNAKRAKNDEFYTLYEDIEKELINYHDKFEDKIVYCNCDDYTFSNFPKYFKDNFKKLKLKKLIATGLNAKYYEYDGENEIVRELNGNGDFRSEECIEFLKQADVVVTNPPFSLFREYVKQLMDYNKKFLVLANSNAITYKEIFPFIKNNKVWLGRTLFTGQMPYFKVPNDYPLTNERFEQRADGLYKQVNAICWYTNIINKKQNKPLKLNNKYTEDKYPKYDNYDAINVDRIKNIPIDYDGVLGVPITILKYLNNGYIEIEIEDEN